MISKMLFSPSKLGSPIQSSMHSPLSNIGNSDEHEYRFLIVLKP